MKPSRRSLTPVIFSLGFFHGYRCFLIGKNGGVWARGDANNRVDAIVQARQDFIRNSYLKKGAEYAKEYVDRKSAAEKAGYKLKT